MPPANVTEAIVELRRPPRLLFAGRDAAEPAPGLMRICLGHDDGVNMTVQTKTPGSRTIAQPVDLNVDFDTALGYRQETYERLLGDALDGRRHRFAREDIIAQEWRIVEPNLESAKSAASGLRRASTGRCPSANRSHTLIGRAIR